MRYALILILSASVARADPPEVVDVQVTLQGGQARLAVTLLHPDTGWDHYADGWRVETEDGVVLGTRVLAHPHETEQPFTRALGGVTLPEGVTTVYIRAKCLIDGWSDARTPVPLP
ncbi:hypothetical protein [Tropicibacter oceani]|uniref:Uncharacterized protein n=1 Tax=Tropicibacter oceani TaxID=3058420 RepID=A0ABY8QII0_9RHOB|nr:hypothetical protein [Tropicibacter oceani]WGW04425.1 hypothetical protein QF118_02450 [Tropicibacter oceani]